MKNEVILLQRETHPIYGLWGRSGDKSIPQDIPRLSEKYYALLDKKPGAMLPFYVLSKDYDPKEKSFDLFIGGETPHDQLEEYTLPEGLFAKVVVKPKLGFLWGAAVGSAKNDFYRKWLPASSYRALNMEYEYHSERSTQKKPEIDLFFAIAEKG